ncbi:hypothetical protein BCAH1134_C0409 (plasmid) [Bacillus cereus AH1134]|nr:hypothetical protein BCAH1134_C0409 [Bacillus cereus AH1134]
MKVHNTDNAKIITPYYNCIFSILYLVVYVFDDCLCIIG